MGEPEDLRAKVTEYERILSNLDCEGEGYECLTHQSPWVSCDAPVGECVWHRDYFADQTIAQVVAPLVDTYTLAHAEACPCLMPEAHLPGGKWNR